MPAIGIALNKHLEEICSHKNSGIPIFSSDLVPQTSEMANATFEAGFSAVVLTSPPRHNQPLAMTRQISFCGLARLNAIQTAAYGSFPRAVDRDGAPH
jgi:hypothetical protein